MKEERLTQNLPFCCFFLETLTIPLRTRHDAFPQHPCSFALCIPPSDTSFSRLTVLFLFPYNPILHFPNSLLTKSLGPLSVWSLLLICLWVTECLLESPMWAPDYNLFALTLSVVQVRLSKDFCTWPGLELGIVIKFCGCLLRFHLSHPWHSQLFREGIWVTFEYILQGHYALCQGQSNSNLQRWGLWSLYPQTGANSWTMTQWRAKFLGEPVSSVTLFPELWWVLGRLTSSAPKLAA